MKLDSELLDLSPFVDNVHLHPEFDDYGYRIFSKMVLNSQTRRSCVQDNSLTIDSQLIPELQKNMDTRRSDVHPTKFDFFPADGEKPRN